MIDCKGLKFHAGVMEISCPSNFNYTAMKFGFHRHVFFRKKKIIQEVGRLFASYRIVPALGLSPPEGMPDAGMQKKLSRFSSSKQLFYFVYGNSVYRGGELVG